MLCCCVALWVSPAAAREDAPPAPKKAPQVDPAAPQTTAPPRPAQGPGIRMTRPRVVPGRPDAGRPDSLAARAQDPIEGGLNEARGLFRLGRMDEAAAKLRLLFREHPDDARVYRALGAILEASQKKDEAMAVYREAASSPRDPGPALVEMERLYRESESWQKALEVCLEYRARMGEQGADWVADEIESLIRSDRVGETAMQTLEAAVERNEKDSRLRELWISGLLHQGKTEKALEEAAVLDKNQKANGSLLFRYARLAEEKRRYAAALAGYDKVLERNPPGALKPEVLYRRAQVLRRLGRLDECLSALQASAEAGGPLAEQARRDQASILADELHRPEDALAVYEKSLAEAEKGRGGAGAADQIRLAMAECHLRLGRPAEASRLFEELAEKAADADVRAQAQFEVGEMCFYQGKLKEADEAFYKLVDTYPQVSWVNDALARILLLGENSDEGGVPVTALAQSEYQRRLGQIEKGLKMVDDALGQYPESRAADDLLLQRSKLLIALGRVEEARAAADTLSSRFPESPQAPRAYLALAAGLSGTPAGDTEAQAVYLDILMRYPDSLEAQEARASLQRLKERGRDSSSFIGRDGPQRREGSG